MPSQRPQSAHNPPSSATLNALVTSDLSPLDAVLTEISRLDREIVTLKSRLDTFSKTIDRHATQVETLRNYVAQTEAFAVALDTLQTPAAPEA